MLKISKLLVWFQVAKLLCFGGFGYLPLCLTAPSIVELAMKNQILLTSVQPYPML